ncbi:MAG TPA: ABC transporter permease [Pseudobdellovibrionaceae bacterium]|nr:ABC transporter permease [Pseudobdellovibrionaceae bacterium]
MKRLKPKFYIGIILILITSFLAVFAPQIAQHDPTAMDLSKRHESPTSENWMGRDQNGADVFAQVAYGARVSLRVAFTVVLLSAAIGLIIGSLAGYVGGWADNLIMRFLDMFYAFPGFLLALSLVAVLGPSIGNLIFAMCITGWTGFARLVRGEVLHLKNREYVTGATAAGAGPMRILTRHIWPNLFGILVVQMTFGMSGTIITESGLSFLGLGAPPTVPTWGQLLNSGRRILVEAPHVSLFPGLAILILVLGFNLVGDGLRDWLNPRSAN